MVREWSKLQILNEWKTRVHCNFLISFSTGWHHPLKCLRNKGKYTSIICVREDELWFSCTIDTAGFFMSVKQAGINKFKPKNQKWVRIRLLGWSEKDIIQISNYLIQKYHSLSSQDELLWDEKSNTWQRDMLDILSTDQTWWCFLSHLALFYKG